MRPMPWYIWVLEIILFLIPLISLCFWRRLNFTSKSIGLIAFGGFVSQLISWQFLLPNIYYGLAPDLLSIITIGCLGLSYSLWHGSKLLGYITIVSLFAGALLVFNQETFEYPTGELKLIRTAFLSVMALWTFRKMLLTPKQERIFQEPFFWFNSAVFLFYTSSMYIVFTAIMFQKAGVDFSFWETPMLFVLNVIFYSSLAYSIYLQVSQNQDFS